MRQLLFLLLLTFTTSLRAQIPTLTNTQSYRMSPGWAVAEAYNANGKGCILYLMPTGTARDGSNARIRAINPDGSIGAAIKSYKWSEGWTSATFYYVGGRLHLMLAKERGLSSTGHNVHCHRMNDDGTVGRKVGSYRWSEGWTNFVYYYADRVSYMLQAKTKGYGNSGYNIRIRRINNDGSLGSVIKSYKWTEGWDTFEVFRKANKYHLLYAKSEGYAKDGDNVKIRPMNTDGTLDAVTDSRRWSEGWTSFAPYYLRGKVFVHQAKEQPTGTNAASKIREINWNGTFSDQLNTNVIPPGWTYFSSIRIGGRTTYLVALRERGYDPGGKTNHRISIAQ